MDKGTSFVQSPNSPHVASPSPSGSSLGPTEDIYLLLALAITLGFLYYSTIHLNRPQSHRIISPGSRPVERVPKEGLT